MNGLQGRSVFLAASFPSGPRGEDVRPYDPAAIADCVSALARAVLRINGGLVFGGHSTITPLLLLVATETSSRDAVTAYQSRWFDGSITDETKQLVDSGAGRIRWTPREPTLLESLSSMRITMLREANPAGGVFIGGMEGLYQEFRLFESLYPDRPRFAVAGPGGAAKRLFQEHQTQLPTGLDLASLRYPALAHAMAEAIAESL